MIKNKQFISVPKEKSIVVDLDCFLCTDRDLNRKCRIENTELLEETLRAHGYNKLFLVISSYFIKRVNNKKLYEKMVQERKIHKAPALVDTDWYVLQLAKKLDCDVLSNDKFRDYWDEFGRDWVEKKRKTFMLIEGKLIIKM